MHRCMDRDAFGSSAVRCGGSLAGTWFCSSFVSLARLFVRSNACPRIPAPLPLSFPTPPTPRHPAFLGFDRRVRSLGLLRGRAMAWPVMAPSVDSGNWGHAVSALQPRRLRSRPFFCFVSFFCVCVEAVWWRSGWRGEWQVKPVFLAYLLVRALVMVLYARGRLPGNLLVVSRSGAGSPSGKACIAVPGPWSPSAPPPTPPPLPWHVRRSPDSFRG